MTREQLLVDITAFLSRDDVKMSESTFGRFAVNDGKLVSRLREGKGITLDTAEKINTFIRNYRPTHISSQETTEPERDDLSAPPGHSDSAPPREAMA